MKWIKMKIITGVHLHWFNPLFFNTHIKSQNICKSSKIMFHTSALQFSSHYDVLGVSRNASNIKIKTAYYAKCKKLHPDVGIKNEKSEEEFMKVQAAYEVLKSQETRRQYDAYLKSLDSSKHSFQEWKVYNTGMHSTKKRDFNRYDTMPNARYKGVDAEWSDFTFRDIIGILIVVYVFLYILITEWNKPRQTYIWKNYHLKEPFTSQHHELPANTTAHIQKTNHSNNKETEEVIENLHYKAKDDKNQLTTSIRKKIKPKKSFKKKNSQKVSLTSLLLYELKILDVFSNSDPVSFDPIVRIEVFLPKRKNLTTWRDI